MGSEMCIRDRVKMGTTVATNALLERKGAKVGLLTTAGHVDILEMREGLKDARYDLRQPAPAPPGPRGRRLGGSGRRRAVARRACACAIQGPPPRGVRGGPGGVVSSVTMSPTSDPARPGRLAKGLSTSLLPNLTGRTDANRPVSESSCPRILRTG